MISFKLPIFVYIGVSYKKILDLFDMIEILVSLEMISRCNIEKKVQRPEMSLRPPGGRCQHDVIAKRLANDSFENMELPCPQM